MKDERKDFFRFVGGNEADKPSEAEPVDKPELLDIDEDFEEPENPTAAQKMSFDLMRCQELIDYSNLFRSNVFFSGIILDIEEISETSDAGEERVENLVALKLHIYHEDFFVFSSASSVVETDIYLYVNDMDSPDILEEFEVGDLVGFSGHLKDSTDIDAFYEEDDALDDEMSPADICWTAAFMMHKNFLDTVGIDIPEDDEDSADPV